LFHYIFPSVKTDGKDGKDGKDGNDDGSEMWARFLPQLA